MAIFFFFKIKVKKMSLLRSESGSRIQNHKNCTRNTFQVFSCETGAVQSLQTLSHVVVDGFLNGGVQFGQVEEG